MINAAVDDVLKTKERREKIVDSADRSRGRERAATLALCLAMPVLIGSFLVNVRGWSWREWLLPAPPPAVARQHAETALQTTVGDIELFRRDYQALPHSLTEVGLPLEGEWTYSVSGAHFRVGLRYFGQSVGYDSALQGDAHARKP